MALVLNTVTHVSGSSLNFKTLATCMHKLLLFILQLCMIHHHLVLMEATATVHHITVFVQLIAILDIDTAPITAEKATSYRSSQLMMKLNC